MYRESSVVNPEPRGGNHSDAAAVMRTLRSILRELRLSSRAAEERVGLSGAQLLVLQLLHECESLSIKDIADHTRTHQSSVSMVVSKLVAGRYATKEASRRDGRVQDISITRSGKSIVRRSSGAPDVALLGALEEMPRNDLKKLSAALDDLAARVERRKRRLS